MSDGPDPQETPHDKPAARPPRWRLLRWLLQGLAVAAAAGALLPWLEPLDWRFGLLIHFRLQAVLGLLACGLAMLAWRRWFWSAGLLLLAAVAAVPIARAVAPVDSPPLADTPPLTVMHLNVLSSNRRVDEVAAVIQQSGAPLVFLQEINARWGEALLPLLPGYQLVHAHLREDNFGIVMLRQIEPTAPLAVINVSSDDITRGQAGVPVIEAQLRWAGRAMSVLSLHALAPHTAGDIAARNAQLAAAARWAAAQDQSTIVLGDLNITPYAPAFDDLLRDGGLLNSMAGRWPRGTWPASVVDAVVSIPIDHLLHTPGLVTRDRQVIDVPGSDHRGLLVTLRFTADSQER